MAAEVAEIANAEWSLPGADATHPDPLLECLVALTRLEQRPTSADALRAGLPISEAGFTPELFVRAARRVDLSARVVKRPLQRLSDLVLPAVLLLHGRQACIVLSLDPDAGTARLLQPESGGGEHETSLQSLAQSYIGYAIFVRPEHRVDARAPRAAAAPSRHWFWGTLLESWRIYRDVLVASFLVNVFALAGPLFVMNVYDRVVPNGAMDTLWVLASGVVIVYVFDFVMRALRGYFVDVASKKADITLSAKIFERMMAIKMAARPSSVGAFANNLREFDNVRDFITSASVLTLIDLPFVAVFLIVIWLIGGPIAAVPALGIALVVAYGLVVQLPLRSAVANIYRTSSISNATLIESLTGVETIKTTGAEGELQRRWEQAIGHIARWGVRARLLSSSAVTVAIFMQQLTTVGVVVWGVYLVTDAAMSLGGLIACVILASRAMGPTAGVAHLATRYHQARAAIEGLNDVMQLPVEHPPGKGFVPRRDLRGDIEFRDVSFAYPDQQGEALSNISFRVRSGERVAVIGRIGSGKTTIHKLVTGLYEPSNGAVLIDGIDVRQIDPAELRRSIGYVPQDVLLFYGSVRDNIVLGNRHADDDAVLRAAEIAGLNEFVNRHPHGFDMHVGERGEGLSGGQRQSVAIARAVLANAPMLLMDEPSNAMDSSSEEALKARLNAYLQDKTLLLMTHRASILELVERLIVLDAGRIVADGPRDRVHAALKQGQLPVSRAR